MTYFAVQPASATSAEVVEATRFKVEGGALILCNGDPFIGDELVYAYAPGTWTRVTVVREEDL